MAKERANSGIVAMIVSMFLRTLVDIPIILIKDFGVNIPFRSRLTFPYQRSTILHLRRSKDALIL
jgi:hypothetical protein